MCISASRPRVPSRSAHAPHPQSRPHPNRRMAHPAVHQLEDELPWAILLAGSGSSSDQALLLLHDNVRDDARVLERMRDFALSGETIEDRVTVMDEGTVLHAAQRGEAAAQYNHTPSLAVSAAIRDVRLLDSVHFSMSYSVVALIMDFVITPTSLTRFA